MTGMAGQGQSWPPMQVLTNSLSSYLPIKNCNSKAGVKNCTKRIGTFGAETQKIKSPSTHSKPKRPQISSLPLPVLLSICRLASSAFSMAISSQLVADSASWSSDNSINTVFAFHSTIKYLSTSLRTETVVA